MFCYIHIPFCESKCKYCRFASIGGKNDLLIENYLKYLGKEILDFNEKSSPLESIYFGGGTPSMLNKTQLKNIIDILKNKFGLRENIEITLETTPQNISLAALDDWEELGINRLSIGIQTFHNTALTEIGRISRERIIKQLKMLSHTKIQNISCDFIIGLPYVPAGEIKKDIDFVIKNFSFIKHISVYMLEDYYTPEKDGANFDTITYPTNWKTLGITQDLFANEYNEVKSFLQAHNFISYEISNFAKKGYECRHNQSYWTHGEVAGFGLGSHSYLNGIRFGNKNNFIDYYKGKKEYQEPLSQQELFLENIMFGIRTSGLSESIYQQLNQEKIAIYQQNGFITIENNLLKITNKGIPVLDSIILELI